MRALRIDSVCAGDCGRMLVGACNKVKIRLCLEAPKEEKYMIYTTGKALVIFAPHKLYEELERLVLLFHVFRYEYDDVYLPDEEHDLFKKLEKLWEQLAREETRVEKEVLLKVVNGNELVDWKDFPTVEMCGRECREVELEVYVPDEEDLAPKIGRETALKVEAHAVPVSELSIPC